MFDVTQQRVEDQAKTIWRNTKMSKEESRKRLPTPDGVNRRNFLDITKKVDSVIGIIDNKK